VAVAPFVCQKCGAALALPPSPVAVSARCAYCGTDNMLPAQVLAARQPAPLYPTQQYPVQQYPITAITPLSGGDQAARTSRMVLWIVALSILLPLVFAGGIMWFVHSTIQSVMPHHR